MQKLNPNEATCRINLCVPASMLAQIDKHAPTHTSKSSLIRLAITQYIASLSALPRDTPTKLQSVSYIR